MYCCPGRANLTNAVDMSQILTSKDNREQSDVSTSQGELKLSVNLSLTVEVRVLDGETAAVNWRLQPDYRHLVESAEITFGTILSRSGTIKAKRLLISLS